MITPTQNINETNGISGEQHHINDDTQTEQIQGNALNEGMTSSNNITTKGVTKKTKTTSGFIKNDFENEYD